MADIEVTIQENSTSVSVEENTTSVTVGSGGAVLSVNGQTGTVSLTTANISESDNLYFTNARALAATLTGFTAEEGTVSASDSILGALQKLQYQITNLDLTTKLSIDGSNAMTGVLKIADGSLGNPSIAFSAETTTGFRRSSSGTLRLVSAGTDSMILAPNGQLYLLNNSAFIAIGASSDVVLVRDGASHTLALRSGTNAQTFNIYNTYTDTSNYERFSIAWSGGVCDIITAKAGTGTARTLGLGVDGTRRWHITGSTGHWLASTDNTYDIGASGANRPRSGYFSANLNVGSAGHFIFGSRSRIGSSADGLVELFNAATTGFTRLNFGGTSSSFIALGSSGTTLTLQLADGTTGGQLLFDNGTASLPPIAQAANTATGIYFAAGGTTVGISSSGTARMTIAGNTIALRSGMSFEWGPGNIGTTADTILLRDAANTLAMRNAANAQTFNIYNTYTDASNYERGYIRFSGNVFEIGTAGLGTGTSRNMRIQAGSVIVFNIGGTDRWRISSGHLLAETDNTVDIGASGATRPRNLYIAGTGVFGSSVTATDFIAGSSQRLVWTSRARLHSPADGIVRLSNAAETDFDRLQFGLTSALAPALKKSSAILQAVLADDSGFTSIQGKIRVHADAVAETPTATHTVLIEDAAGTSYKVLCVAA